MVSKIAPSPGPELAPTGVSGASGREQTAGKSEGASFKNVLGALGREIDRGQALVGRAVHGGHSGLDAGGLIALQAGIYRYSESVDLAAKLVDRASSAVKTTLSGGGGG